ncbi:tyrosine-type recombinase/integrase [Bilifractor sp. HCP3S3_D3]|uniref:tyrosine-type recombinase/integrase n=1 Tax=unclassified Bilifractor TaxID=2815795 RepID=UPI003F8AB66C
MTNQKKLPKGITYRKDGRYMWRFSYNRHTYCGYAARLADAEKGLLDARYRVENGIYGREGSQTMDQWFAIWLETFKASIKESTRIKYRQMYSCHIQKELGRMRIRKITPELLQDLLNRVSEKGLTAASVNSVRSMLADLFATACKHQIIRVNPMNLVHMPACKTALLRKSAFTEAELAEFIRRSESSRYQNIYRLSILTGFRIGEILGLQWKDIDFEQETICVRHTLSYSSGKGFYLDSPKSETSRRVIPLLPECTRILRQQYDTSQTQRKTRPGYAVPEGFEDLCFLTGTGKPIYASDIDKSMRKIIDDMRRDGWLDPGKRYTFHSFRHTFATNCTRKGMQMKTLSTILGHSSIRITMDIYTHIGIDTEREELQRIFQVS